VTKPPKMTRDYPRASQDLLYEIQMIYLLRGYLAGRVLDQAFQTSGDQGLPARNAAVESFAIHLRNVITFLYNVKGRGSGQHLFADDYVTDRHAYRKARPARSPGSALDRGVVERIHQQVAHLSHARGGYTPEERVWLYDEICQALDPVMRTFLSYVDPAKVSRDFVEEAQRVLAIGPSTEARVHPAAHTATLTSNTRGTATTGMRLPKPYRRTVAASTTTANSSPFMSPRSSSFSASSRRIACA
jgi:hypothetical protein